MNIFKSSPRVIQPIRIPLGACLDIPTGQPVLGSKGETYCNGGLSTLTMIGGRGNSFKSTFANYMSITAASRFIEAGIQPKDGFYGLVYDTEMTYDINRFEAMARRNKFMPHNVLTGEDACWLVTSPGDTVDREVDKKKQSKFTADVFAEQLHSTLEELGNEKPSIKLENVVNPYDKKECILVREPKFFTVDSLTEFNSEKVNDMLTENLDSSATNTYAMRQGNFRSKFIITLPHMLSRAGCYAFLVAQQGSKIDMDPNPYAKKDPGLLKHIDNTQSLKGVGSKSSFLTSLLWSATKEDILTTRNSSGEKVPMYPLSSDDVSSDLIAVWYTVARSKSGFSGITLPIIFSQVDGVQSTLTEFHNLMINNRYGLSGNDKEWTLDIYPDVKITRRNIRKLIKEDEKLCRAINITSEMLQIRKYHRTWLEEEKCSCEPKDLYEDLKKMGYDWNEILETRGYWLPNNYSNVRKFLSTHDLLKMRVGTYEPYFKEKSKDGKSKS